MNTSIMVISNSRSSSMAYVAGLSGYGFHVEETRNFDSATVFLQNGSKPAFIVIDVKFHADDIADFVHYLRQVYASWQMGIIVIGCENEALMALGAIACLERPAQFEELLAVLEPVR